MKACGNVTGMGAGTPEERYLEQEGSTWVEAAYTVVWRQEVRNSERGAGCPARCRAGPSGSRDALCVCVCVCVCCLGVCESVWCGVLCMYGAVCAVCVYSVGRCGVCVCAVCLCAGGRERGWR